MSEYWQEDFNALREYHELAGYCILTSQFLIPKSCLPEKLELTEEGTKLSELLLNISYFYSDKYYLVINQAEKCRRKISEWIDFFISNNESKTDISLINICGKKILKSKFEIKSKKVQKISELQDGLKGYYCNSSSFLPFSECYEKIISNCGDIYANRTRLGLIKRGSKILDFEVQILKDKLQKDNIIVNIWLNWGSEGWDDSGMKMDKALDYFSQIIGKEKGRFSVRDNDWYMEEYLIKWENMTQPGYLHIHRHSGSERPSPEAYLTLSLNNEELIALFRKLKSSEITA